MSWKIPVPTDMENDFLGDKPAFALYQFLFLRASFEDKEIIYNNVRFNIKRGQAIFGRNSTAEYFGFSPVGLERILKRVENVHNKVSCSRSKSFTIVTIKNYDALTSMYHAPEVGETTPVSSSPMAIQPVTATENKPLKNESINVVSCQVSTKVSCSSTEKTSTTTTRNEGTKAPSIMPSINQSITNIDIYKRDTIKKVKAVQIKSGTLGTLSSGKKLVKTKAGGIKLVSGQQGQERWEDVRVVSPPKPFSEMTEDELAEWSFRNL